MGLPWWLSGKESACLGRRHGFSPSSGKIPHAMEQLSPHATTIKPVLQNPGATTTEPTRCNHLSLHVLEPMLYSKRSQTMKSLHFEQPLLTVTKEKLEQQQRPSTAKNNK